MSFNTVARCADDPSFGRRVRAAYAKAGVTDPEPAYHQQRWPIAADPSIEPPYESAVIAQNPDPGGDESVVTDAMLTAAVAAHPYEARMTDESAADDGSMHRFWRFVLLRRAVGLPADTDTVLGVLLLIIMFDAVADTIPEPT